VKFLVLSDLHLEFGSFTPAADLEYDAVILAGDIHAPGHRVVTWARRESVFGTDKPVIFVAGNHEFYSTCMQTELQLIREAAVGTNVHLLDRGELILDDPAGGQVRVLGCTLWTDFQLPFLVGDGMTSDVGGALAAANRRLNDFNQIEVEYIERVHNFRTKRRPFTAADSLARHWIDRSWLQSQLAIPFNGATVVITHHAPSKGSVHPQYEGDSLTPAFVSDLPGEMFFHPYSDVLWVHGHTHNSADHHRKSTRILANPRGYRLSSGKFENPEFNPRLVVDVVGCKPKRTSIFEFAGMLRPGPGVQLPVPIEKLGFPSGPGVDGDSVEPNK
jgi:predicted phosphodiesterase